MASAKENMGKYDLIELKRLQQEEKLKEKQRKREEKMKKRENKRQRKMEKMRAKLAAKGIKVPSKEGVAGAGEPSATAKPQEDLPEAEIISAADVWTPKSTRNLDEIQKRIDRIQRSSVKSLKERYKERYGEDMEIPDAYNVKSSIEVETAEEMGEIEKIDRFGTGSGESKLTDEPEKKDKGFGFFGGKDSKKEKPEKIAKEKTPRKLRFLDYRTPWYLRDKLGANRGRGIRALLLLFDILLNILLFLFKIPGTIVYVIKDRREAKQIQMLADQGGAPQPSS